MQNYTNWPDFERRLTSLEAKLDAGFSAVDSRFKAVDARFDVLEAKMATKDDIIQLQRWMVTILLPLILPIYGVLIIFLVFVYNAKP